MGLIVRANEHTISKMEGGRGDGKVIGRNQATLPAEDCEQIRPALSDLRAEWDDRDSRQEGVDLGLAARRTRRCVGQLHTDQQLCVDNGREDGRSIADRGKNAFPCG